MPGPRAHPSPSRECGDPLVRWRYEPSCPCVPASALHCGGWRDMQGLVSTELGKVGGATERDLGSFGVRTPGGAGRERLVRYKGQVWGLSEERGSARPAPLGLHRACKNPGQGEARPCTRRTLSRALGRPRDGGGQRGLGSCSW